jgi:glycosyltransferase involved in cell wall biosynthesis
MNNADVYHVTGDVHYLCCFLDPRRTVLTVCDFTLLDRLGGFRRRVAWFFWYWLPIRRSRIVVVISEATRVRLLQEVKVSSGKVRVIHCCLSDEFVASPRPFNSARPRLLQIGTKWNKNLERLTEAISGLDCTLVVIGALTDSQKALLKSAAVQYEDRIGLESGELLEEYRRADVLTFVSLAEGFGLPIIEAQAIGRVVVTSRVASMPEISGGGACLVDPLEVASIRSGISRVIMDGRYREDLIATGWRNVERFRAASIAEKYEAVYREVAQSGVSAR